MIRKIWAIVGFTLFLVIAPGCVVGLWTRRLTTTSPVVSESIRSESIRYQHLSGFSRFPELQPAATREGSSSGTIVTMPPIAERLVTALLCLVRSRGLEPPRDCSR